MIQTPEHLRFFRIVDEQASFNAGIVNEESNVPGAGMEHLAHRNRKRIQEYFRFRNALERGMRNRFASGDRGAGVDRRVDSIMPSGQINIVFESCHALGV